MRTLNARTGIIETIGEVIKAVKEGTNLTFTVESDISSEFKVDQSVAHNGVCLTVTSVEDNLHTVTAVQETLEKTNLSNLTSKKKENLKFISYSTKIKPEIQKIYDDLGVKENIRMKSSLKFCVVAAGEYDGYVAEPRAYEWDIAAGHAILEHAGGTVSDFEGNEIFYGKKDLKNPSIILKNKNIL